MSAPRVAIGLGLRSGASGAAIAALVAAALEQARALAPQVDCASAGLFTVDSKRGEPGLQEAASLLSRAVTFVARDALVAMDTQAPTRSALSQALYGVGSVAEAAALAGAGPGAVLILPRIASGYVTCAIAAAL